MQIAKKDLRAPENREHFSHRWEISSEELSSWVLRIGNLSEKNQKLMPSIIRNWDLSSLWNFCLWFVCYDDGCVSDEVNSEYVIISIEIHCKMMPIRNLHTFRELVMEWKFWQCHNLKWNWERRGHEYSDWSFAEVLEEKITTHLLLCKRYDSTQ